MGAVLGTRIRKLGVFPTLLLSQGAVVWVRHFN